MRGPPHARDVSQQRRRAGKTTQRRKPNSRRLRARQHRREGGAARLRRTGVQQQLSEIRHHVRQRIRIVHGELVQHPPMHESLAEILRRRRRDHQPMIGDSLELSKPVAFGETRSSARPSTECRVVAPKLRDRAIYPSHASPVSSGSSSTLSHLRYPSVRRNRSVEVAHLPTDSGERRKHSSDLHVGNVLTGPCKSAKHGRR